MSWVAANSSVSQPTRSEPGACAGGLPEERKRTMSKTLLHYLRTNMSARSPGWAATIGAAAIASVALITPAAATNTTLSAEKTLDICIVDKYKWNYSGKIIVTNTGHYTTYGLALQDRICLGHICPASHQHIVPSPASSSGGFTHDPNSSTINIAPGQIYVFKYFLVAPPLDVSKEIKNEAKVTIKNYSGHHSSDFGPVVYKTWYGDPPLCNAKQCTLTLGYWKNHLDAWPLPYQYTLFFSSGVKWSDALQGGRDQNSGYWILARAYIAARLNRSANGGTSPVDWAINKATNYFEHYGPDYCKANGSCGDWKDLADKLQKYNEGEINGFPHCG